MRLDYVTTAGDHIILVDHHSGRRELLVCSNEDPDACREVLRFNREDAQVIAEMLGQSQITEEITTMRLSLQGLTIDWLSVNPGSPGADMSLYDIEHQDEEAAAIVAVIRSESTIPAPPSTFVLKPGDTAVAIGTPEGVIALANLLRS